MQVAIFNASSDRALREAQFLKKRRKELELLTVKRESALSQFEQSQQDVLALIGGDALKLPAEYAFDVTVQLESFIKSQESSNKALTKDNAALKLKVLRAQEKLDAKLAENERIEIKCGISSQRPEYKEIKPEVLAELKNTIRTATAEITDARVLLEKKKAVVLALEGEMAKRRKFQEDIYVMKNTLKVTQHQIAETKSRIQGITKVHEVTDRRIQLVTSSRDLVPQESLEADVAFLRQEIDKVADEIRTQNRITTAQAYRIDQLRGRVEVLNNSLEDIGLAEKFRSTLKTAVVASTAEMEDAAPEWTRNLETIVPTDEMILPELYELVARAHDVIEKDVAVKDILVNERDNAVEALLEKVQLLERRLQDDERQRIYESQDLEGKMEREREELEATEEYIREGLDALNRDNARLRKLLLQSKQK
eukprot:PhF_6_TR21701/c0_g1_i1/m.30992